MASARTSAENVASAGSWGWLPALTVFAAFGLLAVGQSMRLALAESPSASLAFWVGLLLIYAPVVFRSALPQVSRRERIALAVFLGVALYLVKVLRGPGGFIFHDEFPHFATANGILNSGALFSVNSLQEVSAYFPGLEIVTTAIAAMANISIEAAGIVVIGAARIIAALGIYLLYEEISGSPRVASIGSVLAITYPNYTFWSSQFSYESLALPISILALLTALWSDRREAPRWALLGLALLLVGSVVIIHHVTSYFLAASLILIYAVSRMRPFLVRVGEELGRRIPGAVSRRLPWTLWRKPSERTTDPRTWGILALASVAGAAIWLTTAGREVLGYLGPHLEAASRGFVAIITRSGGPRTPFTTSGGAQTAPAWEQLAAFAAVLLITAVIPFGLLQIWRRYRGHGLAVMFALASLAYPVTLVLRLARGGSEIANRSWDFLFVAIGFALAVGIAELWMARERVYGRAAAVTVYASVLFMGALVVGTPAWARLPGPYLVGGDVRGLQAESYALADWAKDNLGPDNRFIADYTNKWLLGSFGEQYIVDGLSWVYLSPKLDANLEMADVYARRVAYVVVDRRLTEATPQIGHYFEPGEPGAPHRQPLAGDNLLKFDREPCLSRVYDSGEIVVYAVRPQCRGGEGSQ
ncbi:MAG: hypothetical protein MUC34_05845 [Anaerolineae bacterium]|nr:hypothetical protein [Anaerolineae bacterium]